jgi:CRP-like cAMP-binding protein
MRITVRLSVVSYAGNEAVIAVLEAGHFFGDGSLASQPRRMATATAMAPHMTIAGGMNRSDAWDDSRHGVILR